MCGFHSSLLYLYLSPIYPQHLPCMHVVCTIYDTSMPAWYYLLTWQLTNCGVGLWAWWGWGFTSPQTFGTSFWILPNPHKFQSITTHHTMGYHQIWYRCLEMDFAYLSFGTKIMNRSQKLAKSWAPFFPLYGAPSVKFQLTYSPLYGAPQSMRDHS